VKELCLHKAEEHAGIVSDVIVKERREIEDSLSDKGEFINCFGGSSNILSPKSNEIRFRKFPEGAPHPTCHMNPFSACVLRNPSQNISNQHIIPHQRNTVEVTGV
jgi:hypothetical protein